MQHGSVFDEIEAQRKVDDLYRLIYISNDVQEIERAMSPGTKLGLSSSTGDTLLTWAAKCQKPEVVAWLLDKGVDVNQRTGPIFRSTALMRACDGGGDEKTTRLLIERGCDVNAIDRNGWRVLRYACRDGRVPMVRALLEAGADPYERVSEHFPTAMAIATYNRNTGVINVLTETLFSSVVALGISSVGRFRDFLAEGVCDARLLIHVANFMYSK